MMIKSRRFFSLSYDSSITLSSFFLSYFHREKIPLHVFSPKYTKLRDWHHEVSARALNVQWFMSLAPPHTPPPQQPAHTFSFTFFFFSNFIAKSVWNLPYERQNSPFSILFWPFPAVAKTRRMNAFCASWEFTAVKPREQIKELDRCRGLTFVFIVIMVVTLEGDVLSFRKWNSVIWNRGGWASNALV